MDVETQIENYDLSEFDLTSKKKNWQKFSKLNGDII